jgi:Spy/CpxP family protein refolding chaperone
MRNFLLRLGLSQMAVLRPSASACPSAGAKPLFTGDEAMKLSNRWCVGVCVVCFGVLSASVAIAQPGGGRGGPGGFFGGGGVLGLVTREEVQEELQLVDEQREKVETVVEDSRDQIREEMRDMFSQMRDLSEDERRERFDEIRGRMDAMNAELEGKLKKVLLPHQFERLKQIDVQSRIQQRGASALSSGDLAEALDLTDEQREKLEQRAEEVRQELQEKIRKLQTEARDKMLDVLTTEQRAKLNELMGDTFELRDDGGRFGGRGGFRGGDRGRGDGERDRGDGDRGRNRERTSNEAI